MFRGTTYIIAGQTSLPKWLNFKETYFFLNLIFFLQNSKFLTAGTSATGLPTKDETSETTVHILYCLFPYI